MKPIRLTQHEVEQVLSIVTAPKAVEVVHHLAQNPIAHSSTLSLLIGSNFCSIIHNCINNRIKELGLRIVHSDRQYRFIRFGVLRTLVDWPMCNNPTTNPRQRWLST